MNRLGRIAPGTDLSLHRVFDLLRQCRPAEILVLDIDEFRRVVDRLKVKRLNIANAFL